jgi:hypothetical protein
VGHSAVGRTIAEEIRYHQAPTSSQSGASNEGKWQVKFHAVASAVLASLCLVACIKHPAERAGANPAHHGRYVGIGIYGPGVPWTRMVAAQKAKQTPAAVPIDDQAILVVTDSDTGEIRACGDLTGYCIGMNPWNKALVPSQIAPISLTEHVKPPEADAAPAASSRRSRHSR